MHIIGLELGYVSGKMTMHAAGVVRVLFDDVK